MEALYTVDEAAEVLKVHPKTVRFWLQTKKLKGVLAGRFWRIKESDLEAFLREPGAAEEKPSAVEKTPRRPARRR